MADQKCKLKKDKSERLQAEKKQEELRLRKTKKSLNPPLNHQYPVHLNPSFPKMNTDKRREEMNLPLNHLHQREGPLNLPLHHYQLKTKLNMQRKSC